MLAKGRVEVMQGECSGKGDCMHIEPGAIQHGQNLKKERDLGTGFMTWPGSIQQDLTGQVLSSLLRRTL